MTALKQREIDEALQAHEAWKAAHPGSECWSGREEQLWETIVQLREDASDLVEAGDNLDRFAMNVGVPGLLAVQEWRNTKARDRNRRWKRDIH